MTVKKMTKEDIKKLNNHILKAMQKKREVEHYIIMGRDKKETLNKLKEYKKIIEKYNLQNQQTETGGTFSHSFGFLSERINGM